MRFWSLLAVCAAIATPSLADNRAALDRLDSWLESETLTRVQSCQDIEWSRLEYEGLNESAACLLEAAGHTILAASVNGQRDFMPHYMVIQTPQDQILAISTYIYTGNAGTRIDVMESLWNMTTSELVVLFNDRTLGPGLSPADMVSNTNLDLPRQNVNAYWLGLAGQFAVDLSMISVAPAGAAPALPCGSGGQCPSIACRSTPIPDAWVAGLVFDAEQRTMICRRLAEYEGRPHPAEAPDGRIIRELLIRSTQKVFAEDTFLILPVLGVDGHIEHSLAGYSLISGYVPPMKFALAFREVSVNSCTPLSAGQLRCDTQVGLERFVQSSMPESPQKQILEMFTAPGAERLALTLDVVRDGDRWELALSPEDVQSLFHFAARMQ